MELLQICKGNDNEDGDNRSKFWYGNNKQQDLTTIWIRKVSEGRINNEITEFAVSTFKALS